VTFFVGNTDLYDTPFSKPFGMMLFAASFAGKKAPIKIIDTNINDSILFAFLIIYLSPS
jgi:hypothetical protein